MRFTLNNTIKGQEILAREPKGWDKTEILIKRDTKYHGLFRDFSVKLEFYCGAGKEYIDEIYNIQGQDAVVTILIEIDCNASGSYETLYSGKLNLKTWESSGNIGSRDSFTSVDIIEIGISETVKERLKTKINLSELETLDGTALTAFTYGAYDLNLHSKSIVLRNRAETGADLQNTSTATLTGVNRYMYMSPNVDITVNEFDTFDVDDGVYSIDNTTQVLDLPVLFSNTGSTTLTYTLKYHLSGQFNEYSTGTRTYKVQLFIANGVVGTTYPLLEDVYTILDLGTFSPAPADNNIQTFSIQGTQDIAINTTNKPAIYFQWRFYEMTGDSVSASTIIFTYDQGGFIELTQPSTTAATTAKAFAVHEAGARISQSITNQTDAFRSDFFGRKNSQPNSYSSNGCGSFTALTNGFQIRKFPIADRPIYMSMDDYFEGLNAIYNLGLGVETGGSGYVIRVEPKEYFYSTNVILRIGNIPDITVKNAENYYYNSLQTGYDRWEIENISGLDEFNSKRHYSVPVSSDKELMAISKFVAGGYPIETARRKTYVDESTTDYEYDNENFIICLNRSVDGSGNPNDLDTAEKNENFTTVNNIFSPSTSYNLRISPARNALRWNSVIGAGLIKKPGINLKMTYKEANALMESRFTSDTCEGNYNNQLFTENQDIQWDGSNTNNPPIWIPEIYEFDYPLSFTDYKNIKANPTYCLEISRTLTDYIKAYILEIRYKPVMGMATFKLLRANT